MHRILKYVMLLTSPKVNNTTQVDRSSSPASSYSSLIILRLLITWLADFSVAIDCLLDSSSHLFYLIDLLSSPHSSFVRGLASVIIGECIIFNKDALSMVDTITQKISLSYIFHNLEELQISLQSLSTTSVQGKKPLARYVEASSADIERENDDDNQKLQHPILHMIFDLQFLDFVKNLDMRIREGIVVTYGRPKDKVAVVPAEMEQSNAESQGDYIKRLRLFIDKQCIEMQVNA